MAHRLQQLFSLMKTGLIVVGMGGVGSTLLAGMVAVREKRVQAFGSLTEVPDFQLGAFELQSDDAYCAAVRAGLVDRALLDELRPQLRAIQAMTRPDDLRGFLTHHGCARGVVVCTVPNGASAYAAAAAQAGCAFVAAARDETLAGIVGLFEEKGLPIAGSGLLGPERRESLARVELDLSGRALDAAVMIDLAARAGRSGVQHWMASLFSIPLAERTGEGAEAA